MNIENSVNQLVSLDPTWVLWLLFGLSVVAVTIMLERTAYLFSTYEDISQLRSWLFERLSRGAVDEALKRLQASPSSEAQIAAAGLSAHSFLEAQERMHAESDLQRLRLGRRITYLGTLGNNAPFVGLLGTVIGIVSAFQELNVSQGKLSEGLMSDIGHALVATAVGLLVALPAVAAYNALERAVEVRLCRGAALGREVLAHLQRVEAKQLSTQTS